MWTERDFDLEKTGSFIKKIKTQSNYLEKKTPNTTKKPHQYKT